MGQLPKASQKKMGGGGGGWRGGKERKSKEKYSKGADGLTQPRTAVVPPPRRGKGALGSAQRRTCKRPSVDYELSRLLSLSPALAVAPAL